MSEWNAKMPRDKPGAGKAYIVIAIKTADGYRTEYSGKVDEQLAVDVFGQVVKRNGKDEFKDFER